MDELKVHIRHVMLWEFKNNKNATETVREIFIVCGLGVNTDSQILNWFTNFGFDGRRDKPRPESSSNFNQDV